MLLGTLEQETLYNQAQLKKLEDNTYLEDEENENFEYIKDKFFANETTDTAKLLNVGSGLFGCTASVYAQYTGNPSIDLGINLDNVIKDIGTIGFGTVAVEKQEGKYGLAYVPAKYYVNTDGLDKVVRLYQDDKLTYYVFVQEYGVGYIRNRLYKSNSKSLQNGTEVPLDTIPQTRGMQRDVMTGLNRSALFVIYEGQPSIIQQIKKLVYAVDRHIVMKHTQYLQNVESFVLLKNINIPSKLLQSYEKGVKIDFATIGRVLTGTDESAVEFVENSNSLIESCIKDNSNFVRNISAINCIPTEFLGLETSEGAVGEGSRTLRHGSFIKKIQSFRDLLDKSFVDILPIIRISESYTRPDIFAKSSQELATELAAARGAKLISMYNAIKKYNNYDDIETKKEVDLINAEEDLSVQRKTGASEK